MVLAFGSVRQLADHQFLSAGGFESLGALIRSAHFVGAVYLGLAGLVVVLLLGCVICTGRLRKALKNKDLAYERDMHARNRKIQTLQRMVDSFEDARSGYVNLITNMSFVMKNVNLKQKIEDLAGTICALVRSILNTDVVEFYTYDPQDDLLKRIDPDGRGSGGPFTVPLGEGLVGVAAKDGRIVTSRYFNRVHLEPNHILLAHRKLWMAAPIMFETQMLGVIAIGEPRRRSGAEKDLLGIVAQVAGIVLYHQSFLVRAKRNADTDVLTGLHNRRYFYRTCPKLVKRAIQEDAPVSVLLLDLDYFKQYNDANGHDAGDRLLVEFAGLLRGCAPEDALVARYGGEEFIVVLPSTPAAEAAEYAEYLRKAVANHPFPHRETQPAGLVSISGGIASFPEHARSIRKVVHLADVALYKAKQSGRNRIVVHSTELCVQGEPGLPPPVDSGDKPALPDDAGHAVPPGSSARTGTGPA